MKKRTGLILTGGGAKAAYQAGAIVALAEIFPQQTCPFQVISGTSAGAINAAFLAASADNWTAGAWKLEKRWCDLTLNDVYRTDSRSLFRIVVAWGSRMILGGLLKTRSKANFLLDTKPLTDLLAKEVDFQQIKQNIQSGVVHAISFTTTQYFTNTSVSYFDGSTEIEPWKRSNRTGIRSELTPEHIMASSAIPVFFPPVKMNDQYYGDGSLRQTTPLSAAIHLGAEKIISIGIRHGKKLASETEAPEPHTFSPSLAQITGELMNSIFMDSMDFDMERLDRINKSIESVEKDSKTKFPSALKKIEHLHLRPSVDLQTLIPSSLKRFPPFLRFLFKGLGASVQQGNDLMGYLSFLPECTKPLMKLGYEDTMKQKSAILEFMSK